MHKLTMVSTSPKFISNLAERYLVGAIVIIITS